MTPCKSGPCIAGSSPHSTPPRLPCTRSRAGGSGGRAHLRKPLAAEASVQGKAASLSRKLERGSPARPPADRRPTRDSRRFDHTRSPKPTEPTVTPAPMFTYTSLGALPTPARLPACLPASLRARVSARTPRRPAAWPPARLPACLPACLPPCVSAYSPGRPPVRPPACLLDCMAACLHARLPGCRPA